MRWLAAAIAFACAVLVVAFLTGHGQNGTADAGDITCQGFTVEILD